MFSRRTASVSDGGVEEQTQTASVGGGNYNQNQNYYSPSNLSPRPEPPYYAQQYDHELPADSQGYYGNGVGGGRPDLGTPLPIYNQPAPRPHDNHHEKPVVVPVVYPYNNGNGGGGIGGSPAKSKNTICGVRKKVFWAIVVVILLLLLAGAGTALGIVLSRRKNGTTPIVEPSTSSDVDLPGQTTTQLQTSTPTTMVVQTTSQEPETDTRGPAVPPPATETETSVVVITPATETETSVVVITPATETETSVIILETTPETETETSVLVVTEASPSPSPQPTTLTSVYTPTTLDLTDPYYVMTVTMTETSGNICEYFVTNLPATTTITATISGDVDYGFTAYWQLDDGGTGTYTASGYNSVPTTWYFEEDVIPLSGTCEFSGSDALGFYGEDEATFTSYINLEDTCTWGSFTYESGDYCYIYWGGTYY